MSRLTVFVKLNSPFLFAGQSENENIFSVRDSQSTADLPLFSENGGKDYIGSVEVNSSKK